MLTGGWCDGVLYTPRKRIQGYINKILIYLNKEISWNHSPGWTVGVWKWVMGPFMIFMACKMRIKTWLSTFFLGTRLVPSSENGERARRDLGSFEWTPLLPRPGCFSKIHLVIVNFRILKCSYCTTYHRRILISPFVYADIPLHRHYIWVFEMAVMLFGSPGDGGGLELQHHCGP